MTTLLVTGNKAFIHRHRGLLDALAANGIELSLVTYDDFLGSRIGSAAKRRLQALVGRLTSPERAEFWFHKSASRFLARSRRLEALLSGREADGILQFFLMHRPFVSTPPALPVFYFTDYTMALARRTWPAWAPFPTQAEADRWLALEGDAYRQARLVFCMSEAVKASLIGDYGVAPDRVRVVGSAPNHDAQTRQRERVMHLLLNGSDPARKGVDIAVAAMALLADRAPHLKLKIIGVSGEGRANVAYLGAVGDAAVMRGLLQEADLVLAPARCDPFPTFVIEAQKAGIPVICSDRDGMPEIVRDGQSGIVLRAPDPASLSQAILDLAEDPARLRALSIEAARQAQRFSWPAIGAAMASDLRGALTAGAAP
jgi:glycogen synthase